MSDTKEFNNRLDYVERQRIMADERAAAAVEQRDAARNEANHYRTECRRLVEQLERIEAGLTELYAAAVQASEDSPGNRGLAARVRQARASVDVYTAATGGHRG